ncbi:hypothetical protein FHS95_003450 [Sphingomonas naasensis]|uniref:Lipoprotein n=1 Tax=Sphingomonas naasensis TaxID=1344951 RepID=A0A4S1WE38_9SPHN|nr:hypothetical protein [Sphingomonas naasensis]NIJ21739.1 hypothetical protein [Sphingomonas naasensis]TGX40823.1 hypothetical protein E5A74_15195 [Sphingomonas naasensis]
MIRVAIPLLPLLAGCTTTAGTEQNNAREQARLERTLAGLTPGEPVSCIRRDQFNEIRTFDGTILYVAGRNRLWRNDVVGGCPGLRRGDIVVTRSFGSQVCDGDIIQTRAPTGGFLSGSCSLGKFTPYTRQN